MSSHISVMVKVDQLAGLLTDRTWYQWTPIMGFVKLKMFQPLK